MTLTVLGCRFGELGVARWRVGKALSRPLAAFDKLLKLEERVLSGILTNSRVGLAV